MFSATCPFYLKVSVASIHIGSTVCALHHLAADGAQQQQASLSDLLISSLFYLSNPLLRPVLSVAYLYTRNVTSAVLVYSSLSLLVACCTAAAALLPSVLVVKKAETAIPRLVACLAFACFCMHVCSWLAGVTPVHVEYQVRALVCAFQLHAAVHIMYQCMRDGSFASLPVYCTGIAAVHVLCIALPMAAWPTVARSQQDILMTHALVAFCPEVLGTAFDLALKVLRKVLDNVY